MYITSTNTSSFVNILEVNINSDVLRILFKYGWNTWDWQFCFYVDILNAFGTGSNQGLHVWFLVFDIFVYFLNKFIPIYWCVFIGNLVTVKYLRLERYHERFPESEGAIVPVHPSNNQKLSLQWHNPLENNWDVGFTVLLKVNLGWLIETLS